MSAAWDHEKIGGGKQWREMTARGKTAGPHCNLLILSRWGSKSFYFCLSRWFYGIPDIIKHRADTLDMPQKEVQEKSRKLLNILHSSIPGRLATPIYQRLWKPAKDVWYTPQSIQVPVLATSKQADTEGTKFFLKDLNTFISHTGTGSLVVNVQEKSKQAPPKFRPRKKDLKFNLFRHKVCLSVSLQMHVANYEAALSKYNYTWSGISCLRL